MNIIKLPQLIDPHVHFRSPGMEYKEDWTSGSAAAIAGGITTVLDMPNTKPPTTTKRRLKEKLVLAAGRAKVKFGFHFGATTDNLEEIKGVRGRVVSTKVFMNHSTGNMKIEDDRILEKIFSVSPLVTVHAEDEMVEKAIWLTRRAGNRLYFCHTYTRDMLNTIRKHKRHLPIYVEVTPHHLFLTRSERDDPFFDMRPPLQAKKDIEALWDGIEDGTVDTIGTDHAPHLREEKQGERPPFGVPGIETALPLMLNAVNEERLSLGRLIELMSTNSAQIFNIPVSDSTYTEVDMDQERTVRNERLKTKCGWSPFAGWKLKGWPVKVVIDDRERCST